MKIRNNRNKDQFEADVDGGQAELVYRLRGNTLYLTHTYVPEEARDNGVGSALAKEALEWAEEEGRQIAVVCPFVADYVEDHPKWKKLYDPDFHKGKDAGNL